MVKFGIGTKVSIVAREYDEAYLTGARLATGGGSKIRLTRPLPQRGHIIRSRKPESGMLRPRAQANVSRLGSA
jgi:hypothetical protein